MPLRPRLSNTGLKLKIPGRTSSSPLSPYGRSPGRASSSPSRQRERRSSGEQQQQLRDTFDASVDGRPVWSVTGQRTRPNTQGFREIPIQHQTQTNALSLCDSKQTAPSGEQNKSDRNPISFLDPLVPRHPSLAAKERQLQRAEILRDWIETLPTEPNTSRNPFFTSTPPPRPRPACKKDLNYEPYKYLSSPLPNFDQSPQSPCR